MRPRGKRRQRRDFRRDRTDADTSENREGTGNWLLELARRRDPSPDEAAAFAEEVELLLGRLQDDLRRIALWKLEGHTNAEIAALPEMKCTVRTVERKLRLIREVWCDDS